jgi:hypothetical protein
VLLRAAFGGDAKALPPAPTADGRVPPERRSGRPDGSR